MKEPWLETYTGKKFHPLNPKPEEIDIIDIAHGLSNICRYNGQSTFFFSVAQHSLNCAEYAFKEYLPIIQLLCLLHDAAEAYISDIPAPIKPYLPQFKEIERNIMNTIYEAFNINPPSQLEQKMIKQVDKIMLVTEASVLMPFDNWDEKEINPDINTRIVPIKTDIVKTKFLEKAKSLLESVTICK